MVSISTAPLFCVNASSYIFIFFLSYSFSTTTCSPITFDSVIIEKEDIDLSLLTLSYSNCYLIDLMASVNFSFSQKSFIVKVNGKCNLVISLKCTSLLFLTKSDIFYWCLRICWLLLPLKFIVTQVSLFRLTSFHFPFSERVPSYR